MSAAPRQEGARYAADLRSLAHLSLSIAELSDAPTIARLFQAWVGSFLLLDGFALYLRNVEGTAFDRIFVTGLGSEQAASRLPFPGESFEGRSGQSGTAVAELEPGSRHMRVAVPLIVRDRPVGAVSLRLLQPMRSDEHELLVTACAILASKLTQCEPLLIGRLLREMIDHSDEAVSFYDVDDRIVFTNAAYHRIFTHYPPPQMLRGKTHEELYRLDLAEGVIDDPVAKSNPAEYLAERMRSSRNLQGEGREVQSIKNRTYLYFRTRLPTGFTMSRRVDITDLKAAELELRAAQHQLEQFAFTDPLTGLANRRRFHSVLDIALARQDLGPADLLLILLDIDRFKYVNDTMGHACGDELLRQAAERLRAAVGSAETLSRLGGDEFAILWMVRPPEIDIGSVVERISAALSGTYRINGSRITVSASIGVAVGSRNGRLADELMRRADIALYRAKASGRSTWRLFDAAMDAELEERGAIGLALREAIELGQFDVYYQPVMDVETGRITGVESLLRWRHPTRGLIPPDVFVPIAEEMGFANQLGLWVLSRVFADSRHLPTFLRLAVNVSAAQLATNDLVGTVEEMAATHDLPLSRVVLEITESVMLQSAPSVLETLQQLRRLGVSLALDDFGTGYASLRYLCRFPFTELKIDQGFVRDFEGGRESRAVVRSVVELARQIGIRSTVEGVETPAQFRAMCEAGCNAVQGFLIARPMDLPGLIRWLAMGGDTITYDPSGIPQSPREQGTLG